MKQFESKASFPVVASKSCDDPPLPFSRRSPIKDGPKKTTGILKQDRASAKAKEEKMPTRMSNGKPTGDKRKCGIPPKGVTPSKATGKAATKTPSVNGRQVSGRKRLPSSDVNISHPSKGKDQDEKRGSKENGAGPSESAGDLANDGGAPQDGLSQTSKKVRKPKHLKGKVTPGYTSEYEERLSDFFSTSGLSKTGASPEVDTDLMERVVETVNKRKFDIDEFRRMSKNRDIIPNSEVLGPILDVKSDYLKERESMNIFGETFVDAFFEDDFSFEESELFLRALERVKKTEEKKEKRSVTIVKGEQEAEKKELPRRTVVQPAPIRAQPTIRAPPLIRIAPRKETIVPIKVSSQEPATPAHEKTLAVRKVGI